MWRKEWTLRGKGQAHTFGQGPKQSCQGTVRRATFTLSHTQLPLSILTTLGFHTPFSYWPRSGYNESSRGNHDSGPGTCPASSSIEWPMSTEHAAVISEQACVHTQFTLSSLSIASHTAPHAPCTSFIPPEPHSSIHTFCLATHVPLTVNRHTPTHAQIPMPHGLHRPTLPYRHVLRLFDFHNPPHIHS